MKFKIDDIVYYVSNRHPIGPANPLKGSEFECKGVVGKIESISFLIVDWNNGSSNIYDENDLESAEERLQNNDPNALFRRR